VIKLQVAVATPADDRQLSIRIKPVTAVLPIKAKAYFLGKRHSLKILRVQQIMVLQCPALHERLP
jgi:hypothetical protein